ncbi:Conserved_hypothetical protein [Hexamita inflata]|uniref:Uncharacterized protein n=1 Tax=Hexamita inflata TaxID=28002 RepID=A0AA86PSI8_9EUKA|nr:Conserved hypothetical protein [Hexamita inflata]CAI9964025.1 Conserved hypothetical protein [Hexamita inflata]
MSKTKGKAKDPANSVSENTTWRARIQSEEMELLKASGAYPKHVKKMDFWYNTEAQVMFNGSGYKLDYKTTNEVVHGDRPIQIKTKTITQLPKDTFVPEVGYSTTNGELYGYGEEFMSSSMNLTDKMK